MDTNNITLLLINITVNSSILSFLVILSLHYC